MNLPHHRRRWDIGGVLAFLAVLPMIITLVFLFATCAHAGVPEQAQASNLAVPAQKDTKYASAVVVTQCRQAVAVLFVGKDGQVYPQHFKDLSFNELLQKLTDAPADKITEISVDCPTDKSA